MVSCPKCGAKYPDGMLFCRKCGETISRKYAPQSQQRYTTPQPQSVPRPQPQPQATRGYYVEREKKNVGKIILISAISVIVAAGLVFLGIQFFSGKLSNSIVGKWQSVANGNILEIRSNGTCDMYKEGQSFGGQGLPYEWEYEDGLFTMYVIAPNGTRGYAVAPTKVEVNGDTLKMAGFAVFKRI